MPNLTRVHRDPFLFSLVFSLGMHCVVLWPHDPPSLFSLGNQFPEPPATGAPLFNNQRTPPPDSRYTFTRLRGFLSFPAFPPFSFSVMPRLYLRGRAELPSEKSLLPLATLPFFFSVETSPFLLDSPSLDGAIGPSFLSNFTSTFFLL